MHNFGMKTEVMLIHLQANLDRTQAQLAQAMGVSVVTICRRLAPLVMAGRQVHIYGWQRPTRGTGRWKALYRAGPGFNMPYPEPSASARHQKAWRLRQLERSTPASVPRT